MSSIFLQKSRIFIMSVAFKSLSGVKTAANAERDSGPSKGAMATIADNG